MEYSIIIGLVLAVGALVLFGLKWYQKAKKDGKIDLGEIIEGIEQSQDLVEDVVEEAEKVKEGIEKDRAARKCGLCGETGHNRRKCPKNE